MEFILYEDKNLFGVQKAKNTSERNIFFLNRTEDVRNPERKLFNNKIIFE